MSLTRWFKEKWVDVKTGKPCGRQKGDQRGYPACRPSKRISSKRISYNHKRRKGRKSLKIA